MQAGLDTTLNLYAVSRKVVRNKKKKRSLRREKKIHTRQCGGVGLVIKYSVWRTYVLAAIINFQTINVSLMKYWSKLK